MYSNFNLRNLGLSAIIAASAALSLGLSSPANAAESQDHNSSRSNKSGITDSPTVEALSETMSEIDTLLSSMMESLSRASELQAQLNEQKASFDEARAASSEAGAEMQQQVAEARRAFEEHVAQFLDPSTVEQVSLNFTKIEFSYVDQDDDGDGISTQIEDFSTSLSSAQNALETAKTASSELISTYDLKMAKK